MNDFIIYTNILFFQIEYYEKLKFSPPTIINAFSNNIAEICSVVKILYNNDQCVLIYLYIQLHICIQTILVIGRFSFMVLSIVWFSS